MEISFHHKKGRYEIESQHYELNAHQWLYAISGTFATTGSYYWLICFPLNTWEEGVRVRLSFRVILVIRVTVCVRESVRVRVRVRVRDRVPVRVRVRIMQPLSLVFFLFWGRRDDSERYSPSTYLRLDWNTFEMELDTLCIVDCYNSMLALMTQTTCLQWMRLQSTTSSVV